MLSEVKKVLPLLTPMFQSYSGVQDSLKQVKIYQN